VQRTGVLKYREVGWDYKELRADPGTRDSSGESRDLLTIRLIYDPQPTMESNVLRNVPAAMSSGEKW
jgi:hypothetical protein